MVRPRSESAFDESETAYLEALNSDPDNAGAYQQYSQLLFYVGRATESVRLARRAVALDRAAVRLMGLAVALMGAGHDEEALEVIEEGMRLDPQGYVGGLGTIKLQILLGSRRFEALRDLFIDAGWPPALVDQIIAALHARSLADLPAELRNELQKNSLFLMPLGQHDRAAEALLEQARTDPLLALQVMWMPLFDPIREHPAYLETLRVLNLEGVAPDRPVP